eukprot:1912766-Amphidinium_carterae.1
MGLQSGIPSMFHWNASALYHGHDQLRKSRLHYLTQHAEDITVVVETHSCCADYPLDLAHTHHIFQSHASSSNIGGILVAVKRTLADAWDISFHEVVPGRVAAVTIQNRLLVLAGHFYAIKDYTWQGLVSEASSFLDRHSHILQIIAADINVACVYLIALKLPLADCMELSRLAQHTSESTSLMTCGSSSVLDSHSTARPLQVPACGSRFVEPGAEVHWWPQPPVLSDHWPISLKAVSYTHLRAHETEADL